MLRRALVVAGAALVAAVPAHAAAPRVITFSGRPLVKPIRLADWNENLMLSTLLAAAAPASPRLARHRPFLRVSLYWSARPKPDQRGRFYPARRGRRALIDLPWAGAWPRLVPASALGILRSHGIPTGVLPATGGALLVKPG